MSPYHPKDRDKQQDMTHSGTSSFQEEYESTRQMFLQDLESHRMVWIHTQDDHDQDVSISRLYFMDPNKKVALMRIMPGGFRSSRKLARNQKLILDSIKGRAKCIYKGRSKYMEPKVRIVIEAGKKYGLTSLESCHPVFLLLQLINTDVSQAVESIPTPLAITYHNNDDTIHDRMPEDKPRDFDVMWTPSLNLFKQF